MEKKSTRRWPEPSPVMQAYSEVVHTMLVEWRKQTKEKNISEQKSVDVEKK